MKGVWNVGPLPAGRRSVFNTGGDIMILSQFGVTPLSTLLSTSALGAIEQQRTTYLIAPLIARLIRDYSNLPGWQVRVMPNEELLMIGVPRSAPQFGGQFLVMKYPQNAWSIVKDVPYASFVTIDSVLYAGTHDGRVVRAFDGPLDNVRLGEKVGSPIKCNVTPSYQPLGAPGQQKIVKMVRPTFITTITPTLSLSVMMDYGPPRPQVTPTLPNLTQYLWDVDKWDEAKWSGLQSPIHEWLGVRGIGFVGTVSMDYTTGGNTLLASIDYWVQQGGVM